MKVFFPYISVLVLGMMWVPSAHSEGKVDAVKEAVKKQCGKELDPADVMSTVMKVFDCSPNSEVKVGDCTIKCLKGNSGNVVGDK
jgi:hypothetical protein